MENKETKIKCMKCGKVKKEGESFNSNKDGSFIACDDCMWGKEQPLERIQEETKESNSIPLEPLKNGEREVEEAEDLYTKGHKKWKATIQPATKDIGNMKPYTN